MHSGKGEGYESPVAPSQRDTHQEPAYEESRDKETKGRKEREGGQMSGQKVEDKTDSGNERGRGLGRKLQGGNEKPTDRK